MSKSQILEEFHVINSLERYVMIKERQKVNKMHPNHLFNVSTFHNRNNFNVSPTFIKSI